jgi:metal-responsive CopG/Arc/MetJ family transcriptional regulator
MVNHQIEEVIMATTKLVITIDSELLAQVDRLVVQQVFPNRSKAIQSALEDKVARFQRTRLARELANLEQSAEQQMAEVGLAQELGEWPEY